MSPIERMQYIQSLIAHYDRKYADSEAQSKEEERLNKLRMQARLWLSEFDRVNSVPKPKRVRKSIAKTGVN